MPAKQFNVHVDPDELVRQDLAAAVPNSPAADAGPGAGSGAAEKHGARDERLAARLRSERDRGRGRASGAGSGRSYAFRRS